MEPYSQGVGRFVRGLSIDDIPQAVVAKATLVLLDTIGVALASSTMEFGAMVTRVAQALGGSPISRLIGCRFQTHRSIDSAQGYTMLALARKVRYELDSTIDYPRHFSGHVKIRLADGSVLEANQAHPRGGFEDPLPPEEIEAKFRANASLRLPRERADQIIEAVAAGRDAQRYVIDRPVETLKIRVKSREGS